MVNQKRISPFLQKAERELLEKSYLCKYSFCRNSNFLQKEHISPEIGTFCRKAELGDILSAFWKNVSAETILVVQNCQIVSIFESKIKLSLRSKLYTNRLLRTNLWQIFGGLISNLVIPYYFKPAWKVCLWKTYQRLQLLNRFLYFFPGSVAVLVVCVIFVVSMG